MINGLTAENGVAKTTKIQFKGKISTGFAPGEGPNKDNYPVAAGHFRFLKSTMEKKRLGSGASKRIVERKVWKENEEIQAKLREVTKQEAPTYIKCISMVPTLDQMWTSFLGMYNAKQEIVCKGYGEGTTAQFMTEEKGERVYVDRKCEFKKCPDYIDGKCHVNGSLVLWPEVDLSLLRPYKMSTNSLNTVTGIESMLNNIFEKQKLAYAIRRQTDPSAEFKGLLGMVFYLKHTKIISGGREVYVTELIPSKEVENDISEPVLAIIKQDNVFQLISSAISETVKIGSNLPGSKLISSPEDIDNEDAEVVIEEPIGIVTDNAPVVDEDAKVAATPSSGIQAAAASALDDE